MEPLIKDSEKLLTIQHELTPDVITNLIKNKYPLICNIVGVNNNLWFIKFV